MNFKVNKKVTTRDSREVFLWGFIGHNRTGKSAMARIYAERWKENNKNGTVVAFDPQDVFRLKSEGGIVDIAISPLDKDWALRCANLNNALIILDDYHVLHKKRRTDGDLTHLLSMRTKRCLDIIYVTHNPSQVVEDLANYTTTYFIFYTQVRSGQFEKKMPNSNLCIGASNAINEYVKVYGRGEYPLFPHIVVDTEKEKLFGVNIDNDKMIKILK